MQLTRNYYENLEVPDFVLCKANREKIGVIPCTEKTIDFNFGDMDEINFKTYYMMDEEINPVYNDIDVMKYVLVPKVGFFYIKTCDVQSEGTEHEYKNIKAQSYEGLLGQKYLENFLVNTGETGSKELEFDETGETHIHIYLTPSQKINGQLDLFDYILEKCPDWHVVYCDPDLLVDERSHRSFNIDRKDAYSFIMDDVQEAFNCYVIFDTVNLDRYGRCGIYIYAQENYKNDTNIYVSYDNLLSSTDITADTDDIKTCVVLKGQDELEIREINFGYDRLYNFDYYNNTDYWSKKLYDEYNAWYDKTYTIGAIERSSDVYTEDISDDDLANMSYLDLYKYRLRKYIELRAELDEIMNHTCDFVNDDERGIGSGKFPVFNDNGEEVGSIEFEQDIGVRVTETLPSIPYENEQNYIYIVKDAANADISILKSQLSKYEAGKNYQEITNSPAPYIESSQINKLLTYKTTSDNYSVFFDYNTTYLTKVLVIRPDQFISQVNHEIYQIEVYLTEFRRDYMSNKNSREEKKEIDYTTYNDKQDRLVFLRQNVNRFLEWITVPSTFVIANSMAQNIIGIDSKYSSLFTPGYSTTQYKINNINTYTSLLNSDIASKKDKLERELSSSDSTVSYPGNTIYRWFDNTKTIQFYNTVVSANNSYESTGTISVSDATSLRDFNPMYNTCLIINSTYVTITDIDSFEEYLEADLKEQTALKQKFPQSAWFNTNSWQGYGYNELTETWALSTDQEITVLKKQNKGKVPDDYIDEELEEADFATHADSTDDANSPWYYFGEYLPAYLTQLAIEDEVSSLNKKIYGYDVYDYSLTSKGSSNFRNLPNRATKGDTYNVTNAFEIDGVVYPKGTNVTWNGSKWVATSTITTHIKGIQDKIDDQSLYKSQVVNEISLDNNLSEDTRIELAAFIREEELSSDNFVVTDTMTEEERQEMLQSFIEYGQKELAKVAVPQLTFTAKIADLFTIPEFDAVSYEFDVGKSIYVSLRDDYHVKAMLLSIHVNYYDPTDFTIKFSDVLKKGEGLYTDIQDALNTATSAATSVAIGSSMWTAGAEVATRINTSLEEGLLSQGAYLADNPDKSTFEITDIGIFVDTASGDYGKYDVFGEEKTLYDSIYIGGGRILFTDDGWNHVRMSLGRSKINRITPSNLSGTTTEEFGVFADFVISGYIAGSQICGSELYSDTYTRNEYGNIVPVSYWNLSNGKMTIYDKTGYEEPVLDFNGRDLTIRGDIYSSGGKIGGFNISDDCLYHTKSSLTSSSDGVYIGIDGIALGSNSDGFKVTSDGTITANSGTFSGTVSGATISGSTITGGKITIGSRFSVDNNGNLSASNASISGTITSNNATLTSGSIAGWAFNSSSIYSTNGKTYLGSDGTLSFVDGGNTMTLYGYNGMLVVGGVSTMYCAQIMGTYFGGTAAEAAVSGYTIGLADSKTAPVYYVYVNSYHNLVPIEADTMSCGGGVLRWNNVYAKSGEVSTSDRRLKKDIEEVSDKYEDMFFDLEPVSYKFYDGKRTHIGYVSQDVHSAMEKNDLSDIDFAGYCYDIDKKEDEDEVEITDVYGLRYEEFIALNTHMIQKAFKRIEELEAEIERIKNA